MASRSRRSQLSPHLLASLLLLLPGALAQSSPDQLRQAFAKPPDNARIMMRWWWFGPALGWLCASAGENGSGETANRASRAAAVLFTGGSSRCDDASVEFSIEMKSCY